MASTTKGSIKISTANGIGAALVDVLGGEGYKPDKWEESINICGIHAADIEDALDNIEESAGTGAERGSILLSTANAIGATLNKKFNTSRGFKPKEWASAASKLEPLPERTASGAIANITDGADGVPLKNWLVTLPASLDGYTEVNGYKQGANVIDYASNLTSGTSGGLTFSASSDGAISYSGTASSTFAYITAKFDFAIKSGQTFTFSRNTAFSYIHRITLTFSDDTTANVSISANDTSVTYTPAKDVKAVRLLVAGLATSTSYNDTVYLQTEYGSTATAYEPYEAPTQYTASLGRTIYGGTVDIITGEGEDDGAVVTLDENGSYGISLGSTTNRIAVNFYNSVGKTDGTFVSNELTTGENSSGGYKNDDWVVWGSTIAPRMWISVPLTIDTVDKFKQYLQNNPITIAYELATATAFTFTPITAETALGVNNFWADEGDSAVTYRKDLDIPDPEPGNLLGMNNENNNENEEESEG